MRDNRGTVILVLVLVVVILLAVIGYFFVVQPSINGYVIDKQVAAQNAVLNALLAQVQQQGFVQLTDAEGGTLVLVPAQQNPQAQIQE